MNTIIVAVDFSEITSSLIDKAAAMAAPHNARVYIIHVASPDPDFIGYKAGPVHVRESRADELKHEKKELEQIAENLRKKKIDTTPLLIQGSTADKLLLETERLKSDLLIMGTHGYGFSMSVLLGSTSYQVLKKVLCPVLLMPYKNKKIE